MKRHALQITLQDDLVLSVRNATTGGHECLPYIPGTALRGWAGSQLYAALGEDAFTVFHSGQVRFGDARPCGPHGHPALPVPLSWHMDKGRPQRKAHDEHRWLAENLYNLAALPPGQMLHDVLQPRGVREGFVTLDGLRIKPQHRERMMTAINDDGTAAHGQLFGYESLARGQRFEAVLSFDDQVPEALVQRVLAVFEGTLRLGRSRSSGYGRVQCRVGAARALSVPRVHGDTLRLWLLSDAWLRDAWGQPTLRPDGDVLGLPGATLVPERTYLRSRRVSAWNAARRQPEMERQVLLAGGVMTLHREGGFTQEEVSRLAQRGIGTGHALGLGEVWVQPPMLQQITPVFERLEPAPPVAPTGAVKLPVVDTPLVRYLRARAAGAGHADKAQAFVEAGLQSLLQRWKAVRSYEAVPREQAMGPGPSQWGQVATLAGRHSTLQAYHTALLGDGQPLDRRAPRPDVAVSERDAAWDSHAASVPGSQGGAQRLSLRSWLDETLAALASDEGFAGDIDRLDAWQRLCAAARRLALHEGQTALDGAPARIERLMQTNREGA